MIIQAGQDVDAWCTKCKLVLAHVVVAVNGSRIMRVQCKTCDGEHVYRGTSEPKAKKAAAGKTTKASKAKGKRAVAAEANFDQLLSKHDLSRARRYRIVDTFSEGEVIDHKSFGLGLVNRILDDGKLEAIFRDGNKVLVHGRAQAS